MISGGFFQTVGGDHGERAESFERCCGGYLRSDFGIVSVGYFGLHWADIVTTCHSMWRNIKKVLDRGENFVILMMSRKRSRVD